MIDRLIVNADDFGLSEANTLGILLASKTGIVTSTTAMMNMPYIEEGLKLLKDYPNLGVGVHLNITIGKPLTNVNFVDDKGYFLKRNTYPNNNPIVNTNELYNEYKAQIERFIKLTGHLPTHLDSHHHVHMLPYVHDIITRLSKEYNIPIRQREYIMDPFIKCIDTFEKENVNIEYLKSIINNNTGTIEIMCHVGFIDYHLYNISSYSLPRAKELEIMRSKEMIDYINDNHIELINYSNIKEA